MNTESGKHILWRNIVSLMMVRYGKENMGRLARDAGIGAATVTRIKEMQTSVGTENLEAIANALGVTAWQLLNPEFNVSMLDAPANVGVWPFELFSRADYALLTDKERVDLENSIAGAILRIKLRLKQQSQN